MHQRLRRVVEGIAPEIEPRRAGRIHLEDGVAERPEGGAEMVLGLDAKKPHRAEVDSVQVELAYIVR
jgi:hypothetical protein